MFIYEMQIGGNLGTEPELSYFPTDSDGKPVEGATPTCTYRVATSVPARGPNGETHDANGKRIKSTEWCTVRSYGRQALTDAEYLKKGRGVIAMGELRTRQWQDKNTGAQRFTVICLARKVQYMPIAQPSDSVAIDGMTPDGYPVVDLETGEVVSTTTTPPIETKAASKKATAKVG